MELVALLKWMVNHQASDLFLTVGAPPHFKVEGVTRPAPLPVLQAGEVKPLAYGVMSPAQIAQFERSLESNLSLSIEGMGRFRINVYRERGEVQGREHSHDAAQESVCR